MMRLIQPRPPGGSPGKPSASADGENIQDRIKAVLFNWDETLVCIPGTIHSSDRHIVCREQLFKAHGEKNGALGPHDVGLTWLISGAPLT
jgi:hypothetical protein